MTLLDVLPRELAEPATIFHCLADSVGQKEAKPQPERYNREPDSFHPRGKADIGRIEVWNDATIDEPEYAEPPRYPPGIVLQPIEVVDVEFLLSVGVVQPRWCREMEDPLTPPHYFPESHKAQEAEAQKEGAPPGAKYIRPVEASDLPKSDEQKD